MRRGSRLRLALGCAVALAVAGAAPAAATGPRPCNGDPSLCGRTLDRVVLPATHNSMSNAAAGWSISRRISASGSGLSAKRVKASAPTAAMATAM